MSANVAAVILAAGKGTRMRSGLAKVLHPLEGRPLLGYVLDAVEAVGASPTIVVVGHQAEAVEAACSGRRLEFVRQEPPLGTGHALVSARARFATLQGTLLVANGDLPLLRAETLRELLAAHRRTGAAATILGVELADPGEYGRVVRDAEGAVLRIVEARDASPAERELSEINVGVYALEIGSLLASARAAAPPERAGRVLPDGLRRPASPGRLPRGRLARSGSHGSARSQHAGGAGRGRAAAARPPPGGTARRWRHDRGPCHDPRRSRGRARAGHHAATLHAARGALPCPVGSRSRAVRSSRGCRRGPRSADHRPLPAATVCRGGRSDDRPLRSHPTRDRIGASGQGRQLRRAQEDPSRQRARRRPTSRYLGDATIGPGVNVGAGTITCNYDGVLKHPTGHRRRRLRGQQHDARGAGHRG